MDTGAADDAFGDVRASELTGELPAFVADAIGVPVEGPLDDADLETVEALEDFGLDPDEARRVVVEGRVPLALLGRIFDERRAFTLDRIAEKSGVPADVLRQVRAALGLPPAETFGRTDLRWARAVAKLLAVLPVEAVVRSARGRGQAAWATAMADLTSIREELIIPMRRDGADDLTVAVALAETAKALLPTAVEILELNYRMTLEHLLGSQMATLAASSHERELDIAVGFVDVVGYTALSARIDPQGLGEVLDAFEQRVVEVVSRRPDVAVVKYLGDAVMLVSSSAELLADAMLDLVRPADALADAPLRGGMSAGPTHVREGDYFGPSVNMAARLTDQARAWSLLADEVLVETLADAFEVRRVLPTMIRGFGLRRPLVVRRADADAEDPVDGEGGAG